MTFLSKIPINANVYRKDWEKNKNFLIFLIGVNFKQIKGF